MLIDEYAAWAAKVAPARIGGAASSEERKFLYLALALAGEAGEVADEVKIVLRDGKCDRDRLASELGDLIYYWVELSAMCGCVPSELLERSVKTIEARIARKAPKPGTDHV
jgi:NTP pyrophosphatase (non-canonical NTP hydrolase)